MHVQLKASKVSDAAHAQLVVTLRAHLDVRQAEATAAKGVPRGHLCLAWRLCYPAVLQAKAGLEAIKTETDALEAKQSQALATAEAKIQALKEKSYCVNSRLSEVGELKHAAGEPGS